MAKDKNNSINPTGGVIDITDLGTAKKAAKKNDVRSVTIEKAIKSFKSNTRETALFQGRMVNDGKAPIEHVVIGCHDCSYVVLISPDELFNILSDVKHVLTYVWPSQYIGWPNIDMENVKSYVREGSVPKG